jgi:hypothetical protein
MKAALVLGMILIGAGVLILVYFASPVRVLISAYGSRKAGLAIPVAGGLSLACGIALLFLCRSKNP